MVVRTVRLAIPAGCFTACCAGGGVATDCCPDRELPTTLYVTFQDGGNCAGFTGQVVEITHGGTAWTGSGTVCGVDWTFSMACVGEFFEMEYTAGGCGSGTVFLTTSSCDPFILDGVAFLSACGCCDDVGSVVFNIAE